MSVAPCLRWIKLEVERLVGLVKWWQNEWDWKDFRLVITNEIWYSKTFELKNLTTTDDKPTRSQFGMVWYDSIVLNRFWRVEGCLE